MTARTLTRRDFIARLAALAAASQLGGCIPQAAPAKFEKDPFTLGVASGDPLPDGIVLWTRLAPDPLRGGGMPQSAVDVEFLVARDESMNDVVRSGTVSALPELAHSVHAEVGGLEPDRMYWYRFRAGGAESPLGRTRTAPATTSASTKIAIANDSNWTSQDLVDSPAPSSSRFKFFGTHPA